jgi:hypothetical protein
MKIWGSLYAFIWVSFVEIAIIMLRAYGYRDLVHVHLILGIALIFWAQFNATEVAKTGAPARTKRLSRAVVGMSVASAVTGMILYLPYLDIDIGIHDFVCGLVFIHILFVFAMFAQSASVATSYDMWEEKELGSEPEAPEQTEADESVSEEIGEQSP